MKITGYDLAIEPGHRDGYYFSMDPSKGNYILDSLGGMNANRFDLLQ